MYYLFRSNVADVKILPLMHYMTNIMCILGHKIFNRKMKIKTGNIEYIMTQKDHKCRYQICDFFYLSTPFRIKLSFSLLVTQSAMQKKNILLN